MRIDGRIYPVGTTPTEPASKGKRGETDHMFPEDWFPIQVKKQDKVGRPDIDQFEAVMEGTEKVTSNNSEPAPTGDVCCTAIGYGHSGMRSLSSGSRSGTDASL